MDAGNLFGLCGFSLRLRSGGILRPELLRAVPVTFAEGLEIEVGVICKDAPRLQGIEQLVPVLPQRPQDGGGFRGTRPASLRSTSISISPSPCGASEKRNLLSFRSTLRICWLTWRRN